MADAQRVIAVLQNQIGQLTVQLAIAQVDNAELREQLAAAIAQKEQSEA